MSNHSPWRMNRWNILRVDLKNKCSTESDSRAKLSANSAAKAEMLQTSDFWTFWTSVANVALLDVCCKCRTFGRLNVCCKCRPFGRFGRLLQASHFWTFWTSVTSVALLNVLDVCYKRRTFGRLLQMSHFWAFWTSVANIELLDVCCKRRSFWRFGCLTLLIKMRDCVLKSLHNLRTFDA